VSYRHTSYRKLKRARRGDALSPRTYPLRVIHWAGLVIPEKPEGWGVPRRKRAAA
jgi:hypothetical protein